MGWEPAFWDKGVWVGEVLRGAVRAELRYGNKGLYFIINGVYCSRWLGEGGWLTPPGI